MARKRFVANGILNKIREDVPIKYQKYVILGITGFPEDDLPLPDSPLDIPGIYFDALMECRRDYLQEVLSCIEK